MNKSIDLTKILKDCPKGTKFYSIIYGEVEFDHIGDEDLDPIIFRTERNIFISVMPNGRHLPFKGECALFPSKDQRDWSKFTAPWLKKEKFDPKALKAFDKVIVRLDNMCQWRCDLFSNAYKYNGAINYLCTSGNCYKQCIPYNDDTKHLVGTTDEAPEYYRYWEE